MSPRRTTFAGIVRGFPLVSYVVLACLFGWSLYLLSFLTGGWNATNLPPGPLLAALVVLSCQGREDLRRWGRRIRSWRAPSSWYVVAVLVPVALHLLIVGLNHAWGAPLPTSGQLAQWPQVPVMFVIMLVIVGIGEESGWTAFAAPMLLRRHGLLVAWVLASGMRILWHLPLMLSGDLSWVVGTVGNAAFSMVTLLVLVAGDGRWTLVAVWHAMVNAAGGSFFFTMVSGRDEERLGWLMAAVYSVVAMAAYVVLASRHHPSDDEPSSATTGVAPRRPTRGEAHVG